MNKIKFGTDGWRAVVAREFTVENVCRVTAGLATYLKENEPGKKVVIGYDCRFGGPMFAEFVFRVLKAEGFEPLLATGFVTTPMVSLATRELDAACGVIITASHNPPDYNGYKLKSKHGGPLLPEEVKKVENRIPDRYNWQKLPEEPPKKEQQVDLKSIYTGYLKQKFNLDKIAQSGKKYSLNVMFGSGQKVLSEILPNVEEYHSYHNPLFEGIAPEPIPKNLEDYLVFLKESGKFTMGAMVDGDADRIAFADGEGNYIDSHHVMLLMIYILKKYKGFDGLVATGFSSTAKIPKLCKHLGLDLKIVPIGFKHISGLMVDEDVLMGGEESGGIAIKGHIPERDGLFNALTLIEFLEQQQKSVNDLIQEVYDLVGKFHYARLDLPIAQEKKAAVISKLKQQPLETLNGEPVVKLETLDGFKFWLNDDEWFMVRPSGTEPLLRLYTEAATTTKVEQNLKYLRQELNV